MTFPRSRSAKGSEALVQPWMTRWIPLARVQLWWQKLFPSSRKQLQGLPMVLGLARRGEPLSIVGLDGSRSIRQQLLSLGFVKGRHLQIVQRTAEGGLVVALGEDRVGLSAEMVQAIQIVALPLPSPQTSDPSCY